MPAEQKDLKEFLKPLLWDVNITPQEAEDIFYERNEKKRGLSAENIYAKILTTYRWYTIKKNIPESYLPKLLDEKIILMVWPPGLREKYYYVRGILFE